MNIALYSVLSEASEGVIDRINGYAATDAQSIAQQQIADPDYWSSVGIITVSGILVVFFILAILIFLFWLMGTIFKALGSRKQQKAEEPKPAAAATPAPAAAVEQAAAEPDADDDDEIMAVISAAVAAYAEQEGVSYRIKDVRRRDGGRARSAWSLAGITENTRPF